MLERIFSYVSSHQSPILALIYPIMYQHWINRKKDKFIYTYKNIWYIFIKHISSITRIDKRVPNDKMCILCHEQVVYKKRVKMIKSLRCLLCRFDFNSDVNIINQLVRSNLSSIHWIALKRGVLSIRRMKTKKSQEKILNSHVANRHVMSKDTRKIYF